MLKVREPMCRKLNNRNIYKNTSDQHTLLKSIQDLTACTNPIHKMRLKKIPTDVGFNYIRSRNVNDNLNYDGDLK